MKLNLEARYGLPETVIFCKRCVMSNQRPASSVEFRHTTAHTHRSMHIGEDGVCDACHIADRKKNVDWAERERELLDLLAQYRRTDGRHDVLVPGSGGKDSVYASHILKYRYGMHPLTVTWAPHLYTDVGWRNFQNWIHRGGFDNYLFTPNGRAHRSLTKLAFENLLHPFQPFILGQKNFPPRLAAQLDIPLVMYGESEAEYGNPKNEFYSATRDARYFALTGTDRDDVYLGGTPVKELGQFGIDPADAQAYLPPSQELLEKTGVDVRYLGYYVKWVPQECYYYAVEHVGFEACPERTPGTFSKYNSLDDKIDDFHYYTTFIKFGIGRTTYDAAQEIRNGHLMREEGVELVRRFDGEFPQRYFSDFLRYIEISEEHFGKIIDSFRSPHLWAKANGHWQLRHTVY